MMRHCFSLLFRTLLYLACVLAVPPCTAEEPDPPRDLPSDTWAAIDGLGRSLPTAAECGPPREDRFVGMFYFLWLGQHSTSGPWDIEHLLAEAGADPNDPRPEDNVQYGPRGHFHHWGEPEWGYYVSDDPFVIRKHAQSLSDLGVDVLFFDVTNGVTYDKVFLKLCEVFQEMRAEGNRTPQIAFLTNSASERVVTHLYETFYLENIDADAAINDSAGIKGRPTMNGGVGIENLYPELWFLWDGKPLMLSKPDGLSDEIRDYFTLRHSWAWSDPGGWFGDGKDKWPWVDHYPQSYGWNAAEDVPEQLPVAVAQHPVSNIGRSFRDGHQPSPDQVATEQGICFAEQWDRALEVDPQMVFITGWNEWVAQRFIAERPQSFLGGRAMSGETYFVDQFNREFSRDIEPMKGGHADNYYWQLAANIRRYKGVRPTPTPSTPQTISIDGRFDDWADVTPKHSDSANDVVHRDHPGWNDTLHYIDTTGRNDFTTLQVIEDDQFVYFLAETREPITSRSDPNWMLLFLDADDSHETGPLGYDYVVNASVVDESRTTISALSENGTVTSLEEIEYAANGNRIELAVPRSYFDSEDAGLSFQFHWADNIQSWNLSEEFAVHGDSAPNRRFNYVFSRE